MPLPPMSHVLSNVGEPRRPSSNARWLSFSYAIACAHAAHAECGCCQALRAQKRGPICTTQLLLAVALWACPQRTTWCVLAPEPYSSIAAIEIGRASCRERV